MENQITIGQQKIRIKQTELGDYLSITDLARLVNPDDTARVISKWIELLSTIDFLNTWEKNFNENYTEEAYKEIRLKAGVPNFYLSAQQWIKRTNAIGIESKAGRYGGTYAHHLIALEFCSTMSADFRFKVFKEYSDLKQNQAEKWLKQHEFFLQKIEDNALENKRIAKDLKEGVDKIKKG